MTSSVLNLTFCCLHHRFDICYHKRCGKQWEGEFNKSQQFAFRKSTQDGTTNVERSRRRRMKNLSIHLKKKIYRNKARRTWQPTVCGLNQDVDLVFHLQWRGWTVVLRWYATGQWKKTLHQHASTYQHKRLQGISNRKLTTATATKPTIRLTLVRALVKTWVARGKQPGS